MPAADINILPDGSTKLSRIDRETLFDLLTPWHEHSERSAEGLPNHIRQTLKAMIRRTQPDAFATDSLAIAQFDQGSDPPGPSADAGALQDLTPPNDDRQPLLLRPSAGEEVGMWLVDRHVDLVLLGVVVGLAVILPILKFFSLEFGEKLAGRPMLSFVLIGLVWWLCLQGSAAGFAVLVLAAIFWAVQSTIRQLRRRSVRRPAMH